ncbi:MAG: pilus assembly protein PilP [Proteobacteria bacterium]|nr:pilus assembly protein PilP [Pseudomonadota bacterium]MBU1547222.1 pilus assembly protein PilP [Pseudomonadota bacterium]MBU2619881.1 pilus assembly protein PilP [Pseudomonadota bacterium]
MMNTVSAKNFFLALALIACVCFLASGDSASAQNEPVTPSAAITDPTQALETALASGQAPPFIYNRERPDPFFPFLTQEIMKAEAKAKAELTGTQKYEPAQLTLVAIVSSKRGLLAMVQDSSGIGYVLRKGTKIGENGEVVQIAHDKVIIEQSLKTVTGERTSRTIEMTLSKEGEK